MDEPSLSECITPSITELNWRFVVLHVVRFALFFGQTESKSLIQVVHNVSNMFFIYTSISEWPICILYKRLARLKKPKLHSLL